jgi:hypothetical protein
MPGALLKVAPPTGGAGPRPRAAWLESSARVRGTRNAAARQVKGRAGNQSRPQVGRGIGTSLAEHEARVREVLV